MIIASWYISLLMDTHVLSRPNQQRQDDSITMNLSLHETRQ